MDEEFRKKRVQTWIIVVGYLFLTGCEWAIVFPSAWTYLQTLGVTQEYWYGFTISAYSFSMGICGMFGGRLADIYVHHTKSVVLVSIGIMAIGNFQYAIGINVWNIIISRLLCGAGTAAQSAMIAEICRTTEVEERTPILAVCNAAKQLGLFIGPAFQLLFTCFHFRVVGNFEVNPLNAPGAFMGVVWLVFCVATILMFYNLTSELELIQNEALKAARRHRRLANKKDHNEKQASEANLLPEDDTTRSPTSSTSDYGTVQDELEEQNNMNQVLPSTLASKIWINTEFLLSESLCDSLGKNGENSRATFDTYIKEFLTDAFVLLQSMVFSLYFCVIGTETVIPMIMQEYFNCGVFEVSLIYMGAGVGALVVYSSVAVFSRYIRDSTLQLIGWLLVTIAHVWLIIVIPLCEQGHPIHVSFFTIGTMIMFVGYPVASIGNNGLSCKVLSEKTQGLGQGVRRLLGSLGLVLGPIWAGATVKRPYWLIGMPTVIILLNGLMLFDIFFELRRVEDQVTETSKVKKTRDPETEPLLQHS